MRLTVGGDLSGLPLKGPVFKFLIDQKHDVTDFGTHEGAEVDFPDIVGHKLVEEILMAFVDATFSTEDHFRRRVAELADMERRAASELSESQGRTRMAGRM